MKKLLVQLFSLFCLLAVQGNSTVPSTVLTYPTSGGSGIRIIFQVTATDALGVSDIAWSNFSVGNSGVTPTCITQWGGGPANSMGLWNNNTTSISWGVIGSGAIVENDQCKLTLLNSNTSTSGNSRMWNIDLTFKSTYGGTKDLYAVTGGSQGHDGWHLIGSWVTGSAVYPTTTMSDSGGSGVSKVFVTTVTDSNGPSDILWSNFDIGGAGAVNTCLLQWTASGFCLWNDAVNSCTSGSTPENSQCKLKTATSYTSVIGNTINIAYDVEFKAPFAGTKDIYAVSGGSSGHNGWQPIGTWTVPQQQFDMTLTATEINNHELLIDDATGQYIEKPTSGNPWVVQLRSGLKVNVPAANNVNISKIDHSWEPTAENSFVYRYKIDTKDNPYIMRLGITEDQFAAASDSTQSSHPEGWLASGVGWVNLYGKAKLATESEFSIESKWRPGLQALFVMSHKAKEPIPSFSGTEDNIRIATAASIFNNSLRKYTIGPAIDPAITPEGIKELVDRWVNDYGFTFLDPYLQGGSIDDVKSTNNFEAEILQCLRTALEAK